MLRFGCLTNLHQSEHILRSPHCCALTKEGLDHLTFVYAGLRHHCKMIRNNRFGCAKFSWISKSFDPVAGCFKDENYNATKTLATVKVVLGGLQIHLNCFGKSRHGAWKLQCHVEHTRHHLCIRTAKEGSNCGDNNI